ncbi:NAD synthetase [Clostridium putrefaciens]|uniref:Glutamine-dependent NAD(+) synthetase n=1 Tax=Clostridium putrefaciens TaxID=99675 RepID=A0A381J7D3_9CLOT|nr:NAD(+) synthase [Clostridium putrefaciens]SUY46893.1 NAD synthetase [Clostridium putrefaciens]
MNFIRVGAACPITKVSDVNYNLENIKICIDKALIENCKVLIFPELSITSYSCGDLFLQNQLLNKSEKALESLCIYSKGKDILMAVGAPLHYNSKLYNAAYIILDGKVLGIVPKSYLPNYSEFYEGRWFTEGLDIETTNINLKFQDSIPFGTNIIFTDGTYKIAFEICEDLWVTIPPSSLLALNGANIIGNLSASNEIIGKYDYRKNLVLSQSAKGLCSYIYSSSGVHESTTDLLFSGHLLISENGTLLKENERFQRENQVITSIVDIDRIESERLKNTSFKKNPGLKESVLTTIKFKFNDLSYGKFDRLLDKHPFVPKDILERKERCKEIFNIQTSSLAKRLEHTGCKKVVLGISGGLDSTLALLVILKTFDMLNIKRENILTITMPGFGTTDRTYNNAKDLCVNLGTTLREINIVKASLLHFKDIGHDEKIHDVTYENVQARERTQILMDIANKEGALVIGTGDLSELALGWCTYNGDHMSMYSVNCSIPKTLVRYLVRYVAEFEVKDEVSKTLIDILETPVSPELLPKDKDGNITQKTEDIVGPYELHDFFLYYFIRQGMSTDKILFLAKESFKDYYNEETIKLWLDKFVKRFFTQQFKRSALPDGPKVGTVSLSPRGDLKMPSDASFNSWII